MSGPVSSADAPPAPHADIAASCDMQVLDGRRAEVGGFEVRRVLPRRERRTVGPWCFVDQMGPGSVGTGGGLDIGPHPHIGLQTVTWLLEGAVLHRDSLGSERVIRPGQLNLMTAGRGVAHAEETTGIHAGPTARGPAVGGPTERDTRRRARVRAPRRAPAPRRRRRGGDGADRFARRGAVACASRHRARGDRSRPAPRAHRGAARRDVRARPRRARGDGVDRRPARSNQGSSATSGLPATTCRSTPRRPRMRCSSAASRSPSRC